MKKIINIMFLIIISLFILSFYNITLAAENTPSEEDIYDVVLFWGQSNMTGYAGRYSWEKEADSRITKYGIDNFSNLTGINKNIIENTVAVNYVKIKQTPNTVFEYMYSEKLNKDGKTRGYLKELNENTINIGQKLTYNPQTGLLENYNSKKHKYYSIQKSGGTNVIPQFCSEYYKRTGRKVIVVMCSNGGEKIANFLPSTDKSYADTKGQYIYEAMVEKYSEAIKYLKNNGCTIGNRLYVVSQGGSDIYGFTSKEDYVETFSKVDDYLEKDLKIKKGAILLTGMKPALGNRVSSANRLKYEKSVQNIYNAQADLIINRKDIILGSAFAYNNYIPYSTNYNKSSYINKKFTNSNAKKLSFNQAAIVSRLSLCYTTLKDNDGNSLNNEDHFTSAALSQMGYECAVNFAKTSIIKITQEPTQKVFYEGDKLNIKGLQIKVKTVSGIVSDITNKCTFSPKVLNTVGKQKITVTFEGKTTDFTVLVKPKNTYHTQNLQVGNILKLNKGNYWWTFKKYTEQNPETATEYAILAGGDNLEILKIDGNWLKVKLKTLTNKENNYSFKKGNTFYLYYGSTAKNYFKIVK